MLTTTTISRRKVILGGAALATGAVLAPIVPRAVQAQSYTMIAEIWEKWHSLGAENSVLGSPMMNTFRYPDGVCYTDFENGVIFWAPGSQASELHGEIWRYFSRNTTSMDVAYDLSHSGKPVTDEQVAEDGIGRYNHFLNDCSIYFHPAPSIGAQWVSGVIRHEWMKAGGVVSRYGYPIDAQSVVDGVAKQRFQWDWMILEVPVPLNYP